MDFLTKIKKIILILLESDDEQKKTENKPVKKNEKSHAFIESKKQTMRESHGSLDVSGATYSSPGNVDREKFNSNMGHRNF